MKIQKFLPRHPLLKQLIRFFWLADGSDHVSVDHILLPVGNIDVILNFSARIEYTDASNKITEPNGPHLTGLRNRWVRIRQSGYLNILGISFTPLGLYPFIKMPVAEFANATLDVFLINPLLATLLQNRIVPTSSVTEKLRVAEESLLTCLEPAFLPSRELRHIVNYFLNHEKSFSLNQICRQHGVHIRTLERTFAKYIGISPKSYHRINRFHQVLRQIVSKQPPDLTTLSHQLDYYDQNHFIKDFKSFTGCTPSQFLQQKPAVRDIIRFV